MTRKFRVGDVFRIQRNVENWKKEFLYVEEVQATITELKHRQEDLLILVAYDPPIREDAVGPLGFFCSYEAAFWCNGEHGTWVYLHNVYDREATHCLIGYDS
jgi:hypothetical protein